MNNLRTVISLLKSEKTKDRQQGVTSIRTVFERPNVVDKIDEGGDGKPWLVIFQALFSAVIAERTTIVKSGASVAAAERRLKDTASALRWLTEKSVQHWTMKVGKALIGHILQSIVYGARLMTPLALDYIKTLRTICSYTPHLEHLVADEEHWMRIMSLCFAILLEDNLRGSLEDEDSETSDAEDESLHSQDENTSKKRKKSGKSNWKVSKRGTQKTASAEQIEVIALIATILQSSGANIISSRHPRLPSSICKKLVRFFRQYPTETSAHLDAVAAAQSVLDVLALNARDDTIAFGSGLWPYLLQLWATKNRTLKERVLVALKTLFPFVTQPNSKIGCEIAVTKLLHLLQSDHETRWSFEDLILDTLRLEVADDYCKDAFTASTFKAGFGFSVGQATTWAALELASDALKELYLLSESAYSSIYLAADNEDGRAKLENPVSLLTYGLRHSDTRGRLAALQRLLFFIDRHWAVIHSDLQGNIVDTLVQLVTTDDIYIQNWTFFCLAAIVYADSVSPSKFSINWEMIWNHAIRRTNVSNLSRAACHTAFHLLASKKVPQIRIYSDIGAILQDISVQGPPAPYDSVCNFLSQCIDIAAHDTRLHRMHLDDKVLSWFIENWSISNKISGMAVITQQVQGGQFATSDLLLLLLRTCGLKANNSILCPIRLPRHLIVDFIQDQLETQIIRGFLLNAQFERQAKSRQHLARQGPMTTQPSGELVQADPKVRKTSAFFLKNLEGMLSDWYNNLNSKIIRLPAETLRRILDVSVLVICFEGSLVLDGITNNRRNLVIACKLISSVCPRLLDYVSAQEELAALLTSLMPLVATGGPSKQRRNWKTFVEPAGHSGVRYFQDIVYESDLFENSYEIHSMGKTELHRVIWQSTDVQDAFSIVLDTMKQLLNVILSGIDNNISKHSSPVAEEDQDGFAPIRLDNMPTTESTRAVDNTGNAEFIISICIDFLILAPVMKSTDTVPTKNRELIDTICTCRDNTNFLMVLDSILLHVRRNTYSLSVSDCDRLLSRIEEPLLSYQYANSDALHSTVINLIGASMKIWIPMIGTEDTYGKIRVVVDWLSKRLQAGKFGSWRTRDSIGRFLEEYVKRDPTQRLLVDDDNIAADKLIPFLTKDEDIRVRFTAARAVSCLFTDASVRGNDPTEVYTNIREQLCIDLSKYEHMITRFICLANIMIASSAVRRGPYWHLLETCLHTSDYVKHIESVLIIASEKMGLNRLSDLFEAYASQIAYSIRMSKQDFFRLPPHLLGYRDRRECAEATFIAFSPSNLLGGLEDTEDIEQEQGPFYRHCQLTNRKPSEGLVKCFSDIVGYRIVFWVDDHQGVNNDGSDAYDDLIKAIYSTFKQLGSGDYVERLIRQNMDGIVYAILRTLGDLDSHKEGAIVKGIEALTGSERSVRAFKAIMHFQNRVNFETHPPNLPAVGIEVILSSLTWLASRFEEVNSMATTYHVMQRLFADVVHCPLINEQIRYLICMILWISIQHSQFKDPTLLKVLINGAINLFDQPDLANIAQGLLDWAFIHLREIKCDSPHFVKVLIRIYAVSQSYLDSSNEPIRALGSRIKEWIGGQVAVLRDVDPLKKRIAVALAAWPDSRTNELSTPSDELCGDELSKVLDDPYLGSYKLKISRRLLTIAKDSVYRDRYSRYDYWKLKDSIPSSNLDVDEASAFAELLTANSGIITSQRIEKSSNQSIGTRYLKIFMQRDDTGKRNVNASIKRPIVIALLDMLSDPSASVAYEAYRTLRLLAGIEPLHSLEYGSWSTHYLGDVTFLSEFATKPDGGVSYSLANLSQPRLLEIASDYRVWVSELTKFLVGVLGSEDPFYGQLSEPLNSNTSFAEQMLPVLIYTILRKSTDPLNSEQREITSQYLSLLLAKPDLDSRCHRSIIATVLYLRNFVPNQSKDALDFNRWLDLDYILLGRSAIICGAYTTALLFLELADEYKQTEGNSMPEEILYEIYGHIDEPDGFYGIKAHNLRDFLLRRFHHEKQWEKAFQFHGANLEAGSKAPSDALGVLQSLHSFGLNNQAMTSLQSMNEMIPSTLTTDMEYKLGWRVGSWDLPVSDASGSSNHLLYTALKAIHRERDDFIVDKTISDCFTSELLRLRELGNENLTEVRQINQCLMCLVQIKQWRSAFIQKDISTGIINESNDHWMDFSLLQDNLDFSDAEAMIATRLSLLRSAREREQRDQIGTLCSELAHSLVRMEQKCLIKLSVAAREARQPQIALNAILCAMQPQADSRLELRKELASVLWLQKEQKAAIECLKEGLSLLDQVTSSERAVILAELGGWTHEACLEKPDFIQDVYFTPAIELLQQSTGGDNELRKSKHEAYVYYKCALFAEQQYSAITRSPDIVRLKVYSERKRQELKEREETLRRTTSNSSKHNDLTQELRKAKTLYEQDTAQFIEAVGARDKYLKQAVEMLSLSLEASDAYDVEAATRLCSLWLAHFASELLGQTITDAVGRVPSRKFVFLAHQLSARLSASEQSFTTNQRIIQSLLLRMCSEHPFHSLYQVYSLQSSTQRETPSRRSSAQEENIQESQIDRALAAQGILQQLFSAMNSAKRASDVKTLCDAYLEWAKFPIRNNRAFTDKKRKNEAMEIPKVLAIRKVANLQVPVTTADTPLDPSMRYHDCIWIVNYLPNFETAGGINLPKISYCLGSDGTKYKQLFKGEGNDDLRQDAVMEQVFMLCNQVLSQDRETRKRCLGIRSYKVIPLAPQAGLLEFVGNTIPMQRWLVTGHARYHPMDMPMRDCSSKLNNTRLEIKDKVARKEALVKLFKNIRRKFRPVLRHFFTEYHKTPQSWFEMRLNYSRSVAVTSIIGHVLGLGDRHISNILLDTVTGEVVHIDLGIAFDQGKLLPVPERVPFRLTADMVDGFGMSGTEGVFRRCSEETLRVLRDGSEIIRTVLEVFRYDPLHSWVASAVKIKRAQGDTISTMHPNDSDRHGFVIDMSSGAEEEAADRALLGVAQKLDKSLSVEYTVNELITEATDISNLAQMFAGWSPFC